jgi:hypothetical protein
MLLGRDDDKKHTVTEKKCDNQPRNKEKEPNKLIENEKKLISGENRNVKERDK